MQITLDGLHTVSELKDRFNAYMQLFGIPSFNRYDIRVTVKGTFMDTAGELVFLNLKHYEIDTSLLFHKYLTVKIDGGLIKVKPYEAFTLTLTPRR